MILLVRFILISIIIYLILRSIGRYFNGQNTSDRHDHEHDHKGNRKSGGVSKEVGEYVDYEEVD